MRILILCDLEGTAGVVDFETQTYDGGRDNEQAKYLATLEINALIDGALEGGATDPIVLDGHGSGGVNKAAREDVERVDTHTVKITGDTIAEIAKKR